MSLSDVSQVGKGLFVINALHSPVVCMELVPDHGSVFVKKGGLEVCVTQVCTFLSQWEKK